MKHKFFFFTILLLTSLFSFFIATLYAKFKDHNLLAKCIPYTTKTINHDEFHAVKVNQNLNMMLRMFYLSNKYNFKTYYLPKGITSEELLDVFNYGGFHILETQDGQTISCGIYKDG